MIKIKAIQDFVCNKNIAVIGASDNKKKFGNIIFNHLRKHNYNVFPVNPVLTEIDGVKCYPDAASLPDNVKAAVFVTKPEVTEKITNEIRENKKIEYLWYQPGSASKAFMEEEKKSGKNIITGECILMYTKASGFPHNMHRFLKKVFGNYPKKSPAKK